MSTRPTFEDAIKSVLVDSRLRLYANGDKAVTHWNWLEAFHEDRCAAHTLIDNLCKDLSLVSGEKIKRFSNLIVDVYMSSFSPGHMDQPLLVSVQVEMTWKSFLKRFPVYIRSAITALQPEVQPASPFIYNLNQVWWDHGDACTRLPDSMEIINFIRLMTPDHLSVDVVPHPEHIKQKLEALRQTHYDYQPYILKGRRGGMLLILKLGCQWPDIAIATWDKPARFKNITNCMIGMVAGSFLFSVLCLHGVMLFDSTFLQIGTGVLAGISAFLGCLFTSLFVARKLKPLRV